jgi:hypothetical protein
MREWKLVMIKVRLWQTPKRVDFPPFQFLVEIENVKWNSSESGKQMGNAIMIHITHFLSIRKGTY